jgi:hypothetical protein
LTRENRTNPEEKSIIDYTITENNDNLITNLRIDQEGTIRPYQNKTMCGKPIITETDHNTFLMSITTEIEEPPPPKQANNQSWWNYKLMLQKHVNKHAIVAPREMTKAILRALNKTIGKKPIGKTFTTKESREIKEARAQKRQARKEFDKACKDNENKLTALEKYKRTQQKQNKNPTDRKCSKARLNLQENTRRRRSQVTSLLENQKKDTRSQ